jgi:short-subunit dehydrogenase
VVQLSKRLLPGMVDRGEGRVLITSSIAATMPGPYYATYAASKSFLLSFADGFKALMIGGDKVVAGSAKNLLQTAVARVSPDKFKAAQHAAQTKPKDLEEE